MQTSYAKHLRKKRSSTVEPVIGTLVNFFAMWRVNTRGIQQANKCVVMAAIAYNLKKMMKFKNKQAVGVQAPLHEIKKVIVKTAELLQNATILNLEATTVRIRRKMIWLSYSNLITPIRISF
jgi:hypothetical protein